MFSIFFSWPDEVFLNFIDSDFLLSSSWLFVFILTFPFSFSTLFLLSSVEYFIYFHLSCFPRNTPLWLHFRAKLLYEQFLRRRFIFLLLLFLFNFAQASIWKQLQKPWEQTGWHFCIAHHLNEDPADGHPVSHRLSFPWSLTEHHLSGVFSCFYGFCILFWLTFRKWLIFKAFLLFSRYMICP